jgi:hypothetical protein
MALRSKPEGVAALRLSYCFDLMLSRLVRCRDPPGVTADVAILTLKNPFSLLASPLLGSAPSADSLKWGLALGNGYGLVHEAAQPDIHY